MRFPEEINTFHFLSSLPCRQIHLWMPVSFFSPHDVQAVLFLELSAAITLIGLGLKRLQADGYVTSRFKWAKLFRPVFKNLRCRRVVPSMTWESVL